MTNDNDNENEMREYVRNLFNKGDVEENQNVSTDNNEDDEMREYTRNLFGRANQD